MMTPTYSKVFSAGSVGVYCYNFPLFADRRMKVIGALHDICGDWYNSSRTNDFLLNTKVGFTCFQTYDSFFLSLAVLYGDPSTSYSYEILENSNSYYFG